MVSAYQSGDESCSRSSDGGSHRVTSEVTTLSGTSLTAPSTGSPTPCREKVEHPLDVGLLAPWEFCFARLPLDPETTSRDKEHPEPLPGDEHLRSRHDTEAIGICARRIERLHAGHARDLRQAHVPRLREEGGVADEVPARGQRNDRVEPDQPRDRVLPRGGDVHPHRVAECERREVPPPSRVPRLPRIRRPRAERPDDPVIQGLKDDGDGIVRLLEGD